MKTANHSAQKLAHERDVASQLGNAPALSSERGKAGPPDSRDISLRWLAGTILTGVTSMTLMGGALLAALDDQSDLSTPETITSESSADTRQFASADRATAATTQKQDRPLPPKPVILDKQVLHLSTITRSEDGTERVRSRPFARVSSGLARKVDDPTYEIPNFDPVTIFSSDVKFEEKGSDDILYQTQVDDEIELQNQPLPLDSPDYNGNPGFSDGEIEAELRKLLPVMKASLEDGTLIARAGAVAYVNPARFETASVSNEPFEALGVVVKNENVSRFKKSNRTMRLKDLNRENVIALEDKKPAAEIVKEVIGSTDQPHDVMEALLASTQKPTLGPDHELRLGYAGSVSGERPDFLRLYEEGKHRVTLARADDGHYVRMDEPELDSEEDIAEEPSYAPLASTYRAIYDTALRNGIPRPLIRDLVRIYAFDVDFRSKISTEDSFEVFYSLDPETEAATESSEILFTALNLGGVHRRYYRFKTTDDGVVDYYDEDGRSAKKFLMRQPVPRAKFRSSFGWRKHPILKRYRLHKGVDWSAARGTPIFAAGNGVIQEAKWFAGYGRWIKIKHANGYQTGYAHLSRFAKGIKPGTRVRQGQVIGYVGSTGLSTGPHLHYEVIVNGRHVNPMRIRLPRGRVLQGEQRAAFERERNRIDQLLRQRDENDPQQLALNSR